VIWLRCGGCGRVIGLTRSKHVANSVLYCSEVCADMPPAVYESEERNDLWEYLVRIAGLSHRAVADAFGSGRERVTQVISQRREGSGLL
jgi:hypothetical protein